MKFKHKPIEVEAVQVIYIPLLEFSEDKDYIKKSIREGKIRSGNDNEPLTVDNGSVDYLVNEGDYIVKGENGEVYAVFKDDFEERYEPISTSETTEDSESSLPKVTDRLVEDWAKWVARDRNGSLFQYENKPSKHSTEGSLFEGEWLVGEGRYKRVDESDAEVFEYFVSEDDKEPTHVNTLELDDESDSLFDKETQWNWLARDDNGELYRYENKPERYWGIWDTDEGGLDLIKKGEEIEAYKDISWNDNEPTPYFDEAEEVWEPYLGEVREAFPTVTTGHGGRLDGTTINYPKEVFEEYPEEVDFVNEPPHYKGANGLEAIDVIEAFDLGYHLGNTVKYILRSGKKNDIVEDLEKAQWYISREIDKIKKAIDKE